MGTLVNARLSDELEVKLKRAIKTVNFNLPRGAEVNTSTMIRGALEEFVERIENERNGVINVTVPLNSLDSEELEKVRDRVIAIMSELGDSKEDGFIEVYLDNLRYETMMYLSKMNRK